MQKGDTMAKKRSKTRHGKTKPLATDPTIAELQQELAKTAEAIGRDVQHALTR